VSDDRKWESLPDPAQVAAFAAFRRPVVKADHSLTDDPVTASDLRPGVDPVLARRVYAGSEGTLDIVPGHGTLTFISIGADDSAVAGQTTTALAARDGLGFVRFMTSHGHTFVGVLPAGGHDLRIVDRGRHESAGPLSADDGYWITVADPIAMRWTRPDGTTFPAA
jgi:hypothetical protein